MGFLYLVTWTSNDTVHERNGSNKKASTAGCRKWNRGRRRASRSSWNFAARSRETHFLSTVARYSIYRSTIKSLPPPCPRHWSSRGNAILFEDSPAIVTISFARRHTKDARRENRKFKSRAQGRRRATRTAVGTTWDLTVCLTVSEIFFTPDKNRAVEGGYRWGGTYEIQRMNSIRVNAMIIFRDLRVDTSHMRNCVSQKNVCHSQRRSRKILKRGSCDGNENRS